ncbi:MAG: TonB-dependent receptor [Pseudomonadota bacterium]|nr:TonB-dependent receptor [Pseudomonadota bacterium]
MHFPEISFAAGFLLAGLLALPPPAQAQTIDVVVVTATRIPVAADRIPAAISVVSGKELLDRDAMDISSALSLVPGVEAPPGGDAGPSSAVPSFWGLHEFDAFLLVVDGVPWGGAFNPSVTTLSFNDIQRIEVLKGAAPVMYGATSFVGVVHAIHYPAGEAADQADIAYGTYGSVRGSASFVLPPLGAWRQSLAVDGESLGFADSREMISYEHVLYRGEGDLGRGRLRVDADVALIRDVPPSPVIRLGTALNSVTPINANFNPADGKIDQDRYHVAMGYTLTTARGAWDTLVSFAYSDITDIRAFLHPDLSGAADTQHQRRHLDDGYLDSHQTHQLSAETTLIVGIDMLHGRGRQTTLNGNGGYTVPLDGSVLPPPTSGVPVNEIGTVNDRRLFAGQYAQFDWKPNDRLDVTAGLRINEAHEHKDTSDFVLPPPQLSTGSVRRTTVRPSETIGVNYIAWTEGKNEFAVYGDYRNAFKPAAIDFGPDFTPALLNSETAQSYEVGFKGAAADGRITYQAEFFLLDFNNLVVRNRTGALVNAAADRLRGSEAGARYQVNADFAIALSGAYHDARFTRFQFFNGVSNVEVGGNQLTLSPHILTSVGLLYTPKRGINASAVARYVGRRYLDQENTALVGGYTKLDANLGYTWGPLSVTLEGSNLTNRRPPVTSSEFGSQSFYLLPARMTWIRIGYAWR